MSTGEELNVNAVSAVLIGFLWPVTVTRALRHCFLCLYVMLGEMRQVQMCPLGIPAVEIRYTVVLLVTGQVLQTVLLPPPLSRATIWENCKEPVDGSNICEIKNSWGGANLYIQWRLNESSAFSEKYRGWIPPPTHVHTHIPEVSKVNCPLQTSGISEHFGKTSLAATHFLAGSTDEHKVSFLFICLVMPITSLVPRSMYLSSLPGLLQCSDRLS